MTRNGFVALAGRPNVGKSTLINRVIGEKVAIVSDRPQTTRRAIRGVHTRGDCQMVLVDLPGVQRPRDALTARMARRVQQEPGGSDAALLLLNGQQGVGKGDRFIARELKEAGLPVTIAVNKVDRLGHGAIVSLLSAAAELDVGDHIFPISARTGAGVDALVAHLQSLMPDGPFLFAPGSISDQPLTVAVGGSSARLSFGAPSRRCPMQPRCSSKRSTGYATISRAFAPSSGSRANPRRR